MDQKICFVVMGFGVKTDYSTGKTFDLDKTYKNIIKPAVESLKMKCIRADEIRHSGTIDVPMYKYLIEADVVIADLSTYNPNAFYELGVRHALRPHTTIVISEDELKPPFDVNHTIIRQYEHLGKDIGYDEATRFRQVLADAIRSILDQPNTDSPVYTYISGLQPPLLQQKTSLIEDTQQNNSLSHFIEEAMLAIQKNDFETAKALFGVAAKLDPNNDFIIQKHALATYKSKSPTLIGALNDALRILRQLPVDRSTDPETLGLAGAIYKRLWEETNDREYLNFAIQYYEKGFFIQNDYYTGINLAYLHNIRGNISDKLNKTADYVIANRIRNKVIEICKELLAYDFSNRTDQYWILATLEEAFYGVGNEQEYKRYTEQAQAVSSGGWERESTEEQISKLGSLINQLQVSDQI